MQSAENELYGFLKFVVGQNSSFYNAVAENLARYPVDVRTFITEDEYLGLKNVYPAIIEALEDIYHPHVEGLAHPLRIGTEYREVVLTGSLGSGKTYAAVLGILYAIYLLSCLRNPHALFGLDNKSEIVFLFQSIRFQTGGVAYKLARELIDGSRFFTVHLPRDKRVKNEILLPNNIVIRPVSGELTAAIGMNIASVLLDELSYMKFHTKSVYAEDGGEYDQAQALYASARARIDSRFSKFGRHIVPMFLAGSARHEGDFIQAKVQQRREQIAVNGTSPIYLYNKAVWQVKPWDFNGETFRVYLGKGQVPPQIVDDTHHLYTSEHNIDVPEELYAAFNSQSISHALRDICGIPSAETGNFIVEIEKTKKSFSIQNIFKNDSCTFHGKDLPELRNELMENHRTDRVWYCHLDMSRTIDSTGIAMGYIDHWDETHPHIIVAGLIEVNPTPGKVIPWDSIMRFLYWLSRQIPVWGVSADQVAYNYLAEHLVPYGFKIGKVSDTPNSAIYHHFIDMLAEERVEIANHPKTIKELLSLNVDENTGKVSKPVQGSKDCSDALVSVVELMRTVPRFRNFPKYWIPPKPPSLEFIEP